MSESKTVRFPSCAAMLFADRVAVDSQTRKHSLVGIFNRILTKKLPATPPKGTGFYAAILVEPGAHKVEFVFTSPSGVDIGEFMAPSVGVVRRGVAEFATEMPPMLFEAEGDYTVTCKVNGQAIGAVLLQVEVST